MTQEERHRLAHRIQDALRREHASGKRTRVEPDGIIEETPGHGEQNWYYVPVKFVPRKYELATFYEMFAEIEQQLEAEGLDVLLVPMEQEKLTDEVQV